MKVAVFGVGLIGGSFALALKRRRLDVTVMGVDLNEEHLNEAKDLGIVDEKGSAADASSWADLILLAVPVQAVTKILPDLLDKAHPNQLIVDFGSTKAPICEIVDQHINRKHYLASHPMAGTEYSGPSAAFATLFEDKVMVLVEKEKTDARLLLLFKELCKNLAMRMISMSAIEHDRHIAYVSHLSHVTSFALSHTVLDIEKNEERIFDMAGSGFASTVRLAKSSPDMWRPIFEQNAENVKVAVDKYIEHIAGFKHMLNSGDFTAIENYIKDANKIRGILDKIDKR